MPDDRWSLAAIVAPGGLARPHFDQKSGMM
jgi:hypothetical protein